MRIFASARAWSVSLVAIVVLPSCLEEPESYDEFDMLRPLQIGCPNCTLDGSVANLSLGTDHDPDAVTDVTIEISNSSGSETIPFGTSIYVPNYPSYVSVTETQFCTVGSTGQPPTSASIEFELDDGAGPYTVSDRITIVSTCP